MPGRSRAALAQPRPRLGIKRNPPHCTRAYPGLVLLDRRFLNRHIAKLF